ncbi:MAG: calcium/sodium antiporter [Akkermansiaceae bacterium]|nr:calcium/sodium antiporter [Akkermansiaceae bacterium]
MITILFLILGLVVLTVGADFLVRGASAIAARLGLSALVIGLTVVAFGTSAPELAVSVKASLAGQGGIAVGNIVGSNIFNVAAILGISALICPLAVNLNIIRRDMPIMLAASVLFVLLLTTGGELARWEGLLMFAILLVYTSWSIRVSKRELSAGMEIVLPDGAGPTPPGRPLVFSVGLALVGLVMLVVGARLFVDNASAIARVLGWSEAAIGLTIVAAGTSMPELATSVVASIRRQTDIAIGNVVGSNIFNLLCIGGLAASVNPLETGGVRLVDFGAMLVTSVILLPLMRSGFRISRAEGAVLIALFLAYLWLVWP